MANTIGRMIFIGVSLTFLFGCAAQRTGLTPLVRLIDVPPLGSIHKKELGDTLVSKEESFLTMESSYITVSKGATDSSSRS